MTNPEEGSVDDLLSKEFKKYQDGGLARCTNNCRGFILSASLIDFDALKHCLKSLKKIIDVELSKVKS